MQHIATCCQEGESAPLLPLSEGRKCCLLSGRRKRKWVVCVPWLSPGLAPADEIGGTSGLYKIQSVAIEKNVRSAVCIVKGDISAGDICRGQAYRSPVVLWPTFAGNSDSLENAVFPLQLGEESCSPLWYKHCCHRDCKPGEVSWDLVQWLSDGYRRHFLMYPCVPLEGGRGCDI